MKSLMQKYNVKCYEEDFTTLDIINDFVKNKETEEAFFIIDLGEVQKAYKNWCSLLPNVKPYYAIKCNPNQAIVETLSLLGANFDCASKNEIEQVLKLTNDPSRIIYANPCKAISHIKYAHDNGVNMMTFDCEEELYKIQKYHPNAQAVIRIAVDDSQSVCRFNEKFGCHLDEVENLLHIAKSRSINVIGISFHVGSGCKSPKSFYNALVDTKKAYDIAKSIGFDFTIIDIGGGFHGDNYGSFVEISQNINDAIKELFHDIRDIQFIAEPGRYFCQSSHTLVLNVIGNKVRYEEDNNMKFIYYLNDGIYGSFNCIFFDHYLPVILPIKARGSERYNSVVYGPSCDCIDRICNDIMLPELFVGDWVYVEKFGAYTSAASSNFNGFKTTIIKYICKF